MESQDQPIQNPQLTMEPAEKRKYLPLIIILAILAASGLGFGGYELYLNAKKDNYIKNLQTENAGIENKEGKRGLEKTSEEDIALGTIGNPSEYIYIGEWGIKIKIPEELAYLEYKLYHNSTVSTLCINGGRLEDKNYTSNGGILDINRISMGCISTGADFEASSPVLFEMDDYKFWYEGIEFSGEDFERGIFETNSEIIKTMLTTQDNYSEI